MKGNGRIEADERLKHQIEHMLWDLPAYVSDWFLNLQAKDITMKSCNDYIHKVKHFLDFIETRHNCEDGIDLKDITVPDLSAYFVQIKFKTLSNGRKVKTTDGYRKSVWFALNNFFSYNLAVGNITQNHMEQVRFKAKDEVHEKPMLTASDFKKMLFYTPGHGEVKIRNEAILRLYMTTGMRKDALIQIDIEDMDWEKGTVEVIDKGERTHIYELNEETLTALNDWMNVRDTWCTTESHALFISNQGKRISSSNAREIVYDASEKALGYKISPHKLRGGLCSILYDQTHDMEFVRRAIRHKKIQTTQRYISTAGNEQSQASMIMSKLLN